MIVENHQLVSESLGLLLDDQEDMEVVGKATSVGEAATLPQLLSPDVVVMDFHLGDGTGHDAALAMRELFPAVRFVFLSRDGKRRGPPRRRRGRGKRLPAQVERGVGGDRRGAQRRSRTRRHRPKLMARGHDREAMRERLSPREVDVLQLMAEGIGTRKIAQKLGISYSTVRTHIRSISAKLGTRSMVNAVVTARELELVT